MAGLKCNSLLRVCVREPQALLERQAPIRRGSEEETRLNLCPVNAADLTRRSRFSDRRETFEGFI